MGWPKGKGFAVEGWARVGLVYFHCKCQKPSSDWLMKPDGGFITSYKENVFGL